ncbi:uncharacterized protein A4U43_C02F15860 [Asparagus officinalis]|uniref:Uncharacterized protein n=1 Tax=Asparagus officinalis TaxID=4686 RepID=A0A5P1FML5_ASPOF|nr:uncharacterized protein A4U43_C02F15860 [Asparagus officinalis]
MDIFEDKSFKLKDFFILAGEEYEEDEVVDADSRPPLFLQDGAVLCDACFNSKRPEKRYFLPGNDLKAHILAVHHGRRMACGWLCIMEEECHAAAGISSLTRGRRISTKPNSTIESVTVAHISSSSCI